jgi:DNA (cytosine-5)-methyltransferase 1
LSCASVFDRKKPLAPATLRRIAKGVMGYVVDAADSFIVGAGGPARAGEPRPSDKPFRTLLACNDSYICAPLIVPVTHPGGDRSESIDEPFRTVSGAHRREKALTAATLVQVEYGERAGRVPRTPDIERKLGTVVGGAAKHAVVEAELSPLIMTNVTGHLGAGAEARTDADGRR